MDEVKKPLIILTPIGIIAWRGMMILGAHRFSEVEEECASRYVAVETGRPGKKILRFLKSVTSGREVVTSSPQLAKVMSELGFDVEVVGLPAGLMMESLLVEAGFAESIGEALEVTRRIMMLITSLKIKEDLKEKDKVIIHAVNAFEENTENINTVYERLREWYGIHFPELERHVQKMQTYAKLVADLPSRENYTSDKLLSMGLEERIVGRLVEAARASLGADLAAEDLEQIRTYAEDMKELISRRNRIEKYVDRALTENAPNLSSLTGVKLAGKLIARAGGLRKLAMLPAGTIQILGAEKALFRALKTGTRPPKHGVIFQHTSINQAPRNLRGKIARALATKIAIAARVDVFGGEDRVEELKAAFERRVEEIMRKPSPRKKQRMRKRRR